MPRKSKTIRTLKLKTGKRNIQNADSLVKFYSTPEYNQKTVIHSATVEQTCQKIIQLVQMWQPQTERISKVLQLSSKNRKQTAQTLWNYFFTYYQYNEDRGGIEQLRSPRRAFFDATKRHDNPNPIGCDCDCFTISILTMLANAGITDAAAKVIQRTGETDFSHIYVVLPIHEGKIDWNNPDTYYTIDPVVHQFNTETNDISKYKIYKMKTNPTLNGLGNIQVASLDGINTSLPSSYPPLAKQILQNILRSNPTSIDYKIQMQYAIAIEQKWIQQGIIPIGSNYFILLQKNTTLNGWLKDTWNKAKDYVKDTIQDYKKYDAKTSALHTLNIAQFLPAREGLKQALKYNLLGLASLMWFVKLKDSNKYNEILKIWYKFGGDDGTIEAYIREGKDVTPRQIAPSVLNKIPQVKNLIEKANTVFYSKYKINGLSGDPATGAAIVEALPIVLEITVAIAGIVAAIKATSTKDDNNNGNSNTNDGNSPGGGSDGKTGNILMIGAAALAAKLIFF